MWEINELEKIEKLVSFAFSETLVENLNLSSFLFATFLVSIPSYALASDPKLISTLNSAFEKLEKYILRLSTPAADETRRRIYFRKSKMW